MRPIGEVLTRTLVGLPFVCLAYWFPIRRWWRRWGATDLDVARAMPGDVEVSAPTYSATLAVTIHALPEHIWPWLVQMGYRRGGLYDRAGFGLKNRRSAPWKVHDGGLESSFECART